MKQTSSYSILFLSLLLSLGAVAFAAETEEQRVANLIRGAKAEGKLVTYNATPGRLEEEAKVIKTFQGKYPFIKMEAVYGGSEVIFARILAEARAGKLQADVVGSSFPHMHTYREKGMIMKYQSPITASFPESGKDSEGYWTSFYENPYVFGYNVNVIAPKDVPKTFEDLLHPRWKGKMAMDSKDERWYGTLVEYWGRKKGMDFMTKLSQQNIIIRTGKSLLAQLLAAGEFSAVISLYVDNAEAMKEKGGPIDWVFLEPVLLGAHPLWIPTTAPHKNAAMLYVDFLLSDEGQELMASFKRFPSKRTEKSDKMLAKFYTRLSTKKSIGIPDEVSRRYAEYSKEFRSLFIKGGK